MVRCVMFFVVVVFVLNVGGVVAKEETKSTVAVLVRQTVRHPQLGYLKE